MITKIKRHSRTVLSVILAVCMLASCMAVGIIATSAAYVDGKSVPEAANAADIPGGGAKGSKDGGEELGAAADDEALGWTTSNCKVHYKIGNDEWADANMDSSGIMTITYSGSSSVTMLFDLVAENWWYKGKEGQYTINSVTTNDSANYYAWYENSSDSGNKGDRDYQVTLPSAGTYKFRYVTRTAKGSQSDAELQFNFWKVNTSYTISYNNPTNGSFTTKPTSANSGASVSIVATPSTGYQVESFTVTNSSTSEAITTTNSGTTYTFTMPSANVSVSATFSKRDYTITKSQSNCTISVTGGATTAQYGDTVSFTVTPDTDYALKTLTVKQDSTTITNTSEGENTYSFTMPAGNVTITAVCATTTGTLDVYFKSATAWVYHPVISINDGAEQLMTIESYLDNSTNSYKPKSPTGSLRYGWYKVSLTGVDTSKPVSIFIKGQDSSMEATGTFTLGSGDSIYLACDNIMEGSTLVDLSNKSDAVKDFYESPLHMVATATEEAALNN